MSERALHGRLPTPRSVLGRALQAVVVGVTIYVLDSSLATAATTAILFLTFTVTIDAAETVIGDYADNVALGVLVLAFTGYLTVDGFPPALAVGGPVGGWLVFDGLQHLRHGESRDALSLPYSHDGGPVSGFVRAMIARLLEPFRL